MAEDKHPQLELDALLETGNENAAAIAAGMAMAEPKTIREDVPSFAVIPQGATIQVFEHHRADPPVRIKTSASFYEAGSFIRYVKDFAGLGSRLFGDEKSGAFRAILDYHRSATEPQWGSHQAMLALRTTESWARWIGNNGKKMDQVTFATFLEDNLPDIAEPAGATLLEVARSMEVKKNVVFASSVRLDNGQHQLTYEENVQGTAQKGALTIPERFVLGLAPWHGVEPYRVDARLRYRMQDGRLTLWYDLFRVEDIVREAFESVRAFLAAQTQLDVLLGAVTMNEAGR